MMIQGTVVSSAANGCHRVIGSYQGRRPSLYLRQLPCEKVTGGFELASQQ